MSIQPLCKPTFCQFVLGRFFHSSIQLYNEAKNRHMTNNKHLRVEGSRFFTHFEARPRLLRGT